jgi:phospholipase/carboxylesterase
LQQALVHKQAIQSPITSCTATWLCNISFTCRADRRVPRRSSFCSTAWEVTSKTSTRYFPNSRRKYAIVSARAPYTLAEGSYQWFQGTLVNNRLDGDPQQIAASRARIGVFVDQVVTKYRLDPHQVYLVGFSQGAIMSYQIALTEPAKIRGIGVMSGAIFGSFVPLIKASPELSHLRIFISHGQADHRIPIGYAQEADQRLKGLGLKPEFHVYPGMQHEINSDALADLVSWLRGS